MSGLTGDGKMAALAPASVIRPPFVAPDLFLGGGKGVRIGQSAIIPNPVVAPGLTRGLAYLVSRIGEPLVPQVDPIRVVRFDQSELPFPSPFLDELFASDRR